MEIPVDALKFVESTILTEPPANFVSGIWEALNVYGTLVLPAAPTGALVSFERGSNDTSFKINVEKDV